MKRLLISICITISLILPFAFAESKTELDSTKYYHVKFDLSLVPGLSIGSAFPNDKKISDRYALNLLAGRCDRLEKGAIGGIWNWVREDANGWMIAGALNQSGKAMTGAQFTAGLNLSGGDLSGIGLGGIGNLAAEDINGLNFAGLGNVSGRSINGVQLVGLANVGRKSINGVQGAGFANITGGSMSGIQYAGSFNIARKDCDGIIVDGGGLLNGGSSSGVILSGVFNLSRGSADGMIGAGTANIIGNKADGLIAAGAVNVINGDVDGMIGSGALNFVNGTMSGMQIGTVNFAKSSNGCQMGLINFAGESEGAELGLISYSQKHGARGELFGDEMGNAFTSLRTGNKDWYNRIAVGYAAYGSPNITVFGGGFGKIKRYTGYHTEFGTEFYLLNFENDLQFGTKPNIATLLKFQYSWNLKVSDDFVLFAGPSMNFMFSHYSDGSELMSPAFYKSHSGSYYKRGWIGGILGLRML